MKRYYIWRSLLVRGWYSDSVIGSSDDFDEAKSLGQARAGGINPEWKQTSGYSWALLTNGVNREIYIYDRKGSES